MKKFWRVFKKILTVISGICAAVLFVVVLTSAIKKQNELVCRNVQVKIDDDSGIAFLTKEEVKDHINFFCGGSAVDKPLSALNLKALEREEEKNPFVENAEIFVDQQQDVIVQVEQKRPIVRVINKDGVGYYLSEKNERIPLNDKFTPHVTIALGNVETHLDPKRDSTVQIALYNLITYIKRDTFLDALVDQVYVQESGDMDLIPKIGGRSIHFGKVDKSTGDKMDRLKTFYKEGLTRVGWTRYKSIDLRFNDQVVCEKRDTTNTL